MNMKRDVVADLHVALAFLKLEVSEEEIKQKRYGKVTAAAVRRFQSENGLRKTGKVDEETAHVLNQRLHEAGKLDDFFTVQNQLAINISTAMDLKLSDNAKSKLISKFDTKVLDASLANYSGEQKLEEIEVLKKKKDKVGLKKKKEEQLQKSANARFKIPEVPF